LTLCPDFNSVEERDTIENEVEMFDKVEEKSNDITVIEMSCQANMDLEDSQAQITPVMEESWCQVTQNMEDTYVQTEMELPEPELKPEASDKETQTENDNLVTNKFASHLMLPRILTPSSRGSQQKMDFEQEKHDLTEAKEALEKELQNIKKREVMEKKIKEKI